MDSLRDQRRTVAAKRTVAATPSSVAFLLLGVLVRRLLGDAASIFQEAVRRSS
jgi:hypothetical protein